MVRKNTLILIVVAIAAFGIGWFAKQSLTNNNQTVEVRANSDSYTFINPLFYYRNIPDQELNDLKSKLNSYIKDQKAKGSAKEISVYYRDMNSGRWTGVNEDITYVPASMLKVAYMMSYLKRAEDNPDILQKKLHYDASNGEQATFNVRNSKLQNGNYSVNDLINYMIVYSDNAALMALAKEDEGRTDSVFKLFQLPIQADATSTPDFMSARTYSRIFRVLYDSTFLSWDLSEQALKILSLTSYKDGLQKGIPEDVNISHKFGERTIYDKNGTVVNRELHDCGIVYKSENPYFVCVMTRGDDFLKLQNIIQEVSSLVYSEVK